MNDLVGITRQDLKCECMTDIMGETNEVSSYFRGFLASDLSPVFLVMVS